MRHNEYGAEAEDEDEDLQYLDDDSLLAAELDRNTDEIETITYSYDQWNSCGEIPGLIRLDNQGNANSHSPVGRIAIASKPIECAHLPFIADDGNTLLSLYTDSASGLFIGTGGSETIKISSYYPVTLLRALRKQVQSKALEIEVKKGGPHSQSKDKDGSSSLATVAVVTVYAYVQSENLLSLPLIIIKWLQNNSNTKQPWTSSGAGTDNISNPSLPCSLKFDSNEFLGYLGKLSGGSNISINTTSQSRKSRCGVCAVCANSGCISELGDISGAQCCMYGNQLLQLNRELCSKAGLVTDLRIYQLQGKRKRKRKRKRKSKITITLFDTNNT